VRVYSQKNYEDECVRCRLSAEEKALLGRLTANLPDVSRPNIIFESIGVFERCVDTYVFKRLEELRSHEAIESEGQMLHSLRGKLEYNVLAPEQPLFSTRNIGTGQQMSVFRATHQNAALAKNTRTVHVGEFYFTVRVFDELKLNLDMLVGSLMTLAFVRHGDAAYSVNVRVMGVDSDLGQIRFFHTLDLFRSQKRQYMRLEVSSPMRYRVLQKADKDDKPTPQMFAARISDISGGGMSFFSDDPSEAGDIILATVMLPGETLGGVKSKVLAVVPVQGSAATHYRHHVQYIDIEPRQRERIIKYVFEKQRQMLQMR
jgi:c-di-GMP-binding flagellar brake protein YcgR